MHGRNGYERYQKGNRGMKNKLIDLYREYVRCADMCDEYNGEHKTNIQARECLQLKSATGEWVGYFSLNEPNFSELMDHKIRFAVAILRGRTVFPGDTVYSPTNTKVGVKTTSLQTLEGVNSGWNLSFEIISDEWSWEQQKNPHTFMLNGVELPIPRKEFSQNKVHLHMVDYRPPKVYEEIFTFETIDEAVEFYDGLRNILRDARDKE